MNNLNFSPKLTENTTKLIINNNLKQCCSYKSNINNLIFNLSLLLLFIFICIIIVIWKKKTKITNKEKKERKEKYKNYIFNKIKSIKKNSNRNKLITNLPEFKTF